ncbi:M48 family metallopeptidase [Clostridium ljungdahlii]|uniref:WLM domain protein n=1 Tax=Clostridium ljungdahlii TaxID=1538 RepID=A0A162L3E9_9CLOT|nr:SprT family zinc-dependent metalloprotease [Clostridium ljungdahlii]OAA88006.1 WLM domain protein [Clostridium ljungdahlii]
METTHRLSSFEYKVIKKNIKNITIKINEQGEVYIIAPLNVSYPSIEKIVENKMGWIQENVKITKNRIYTMKSTGLLDGKKLLWMGNLLKIEVRQADIKKCYVEIAEDKIIVYGKAVLLKNEENIKKSICEFYKQRARVIFRERVDIYYKNLNVYPQKITIRCQKTRWGSCSSNGNINLNYKILMAPMEIIDYVVVHELCHLVHMDHSRDYWKLVESIIPQYKNRRKWLKCNGYMLNFPKKYI